MNILDSFRNIFAIPDLRKRVIFTFLLLGTTEALMVNVLGMMASIAIRTQPDARRQFRPKRLLSYQVLYNAANSVLGHAAMGAVFLALGGRFGHADLQRIAVPALAGAFVYYVVNAAGIAINEAPALASDR